MVIVVSSPPHSHIPFPPFIWESGKRSSLSLFPLFFIPLNSHRHPSRSRWQRSRDGGWGKKKKTDASTVWEGVVRSKALVSIFLLTTALCRVGVWRRRDNTFLFPSLQCFSACIPVENPPKAFLSRQFTRKSRTQVLSGLKLFFFGIRRPQHRHMRLDDGPFYLVPKTPPSALSLSKEKKMRKKQIFVLYESTTRKSPEGVKREAVFLSFIFPPPWKKRKGLPHIFFLGGCGSAEIVFW